MKQKQHKILLVEPPFYRLHKKTYSLDKYPLSLGYLSAMIKKETNWRVVAYNADFTPQSEIMKVSYLTGIGFNNYLNNLRDLSAPIWREITSNILKYKPDVVGISAKSQSFASVCAIAKLLKKINKHLIVIVGGPHPSMVGSDVLKCPDIDVCVQGEGEITIIELLNAIAAQEEFDDIHGIVYRKNGQVVENPPRAYIQDLDSLPFPQETAPEVLIEYDKYPISAFSRIFATRGCPYTCSFCGSHKIWSRKVRFRSPENVIEEIKALQNKGITSLSFNDDTFGVHNQYIKDICNALIEDCQGLKWCSEMPVKLINDENISLMKAAGCYQIHVGIESGNNDILKKIRKNITIEEALSACEIIKKNDIELLTFFMVGFPQETEETLNDTFTVMKNIESTIIFSIFTPYPGSEAFELCKENGLIDDDYDSSFYGHQSPRNCFCKNISPERFRALVSKIEKMVDRRRKMNYAKEIFSSEIFSKIRKRGMVKSFQSLRKVLVLISK